MGQLIAAVSNFGKYLRIAPRVDATLLSIAEGFRKLARDDRAQMGRGGGLIAMPGGVPESYFAGKAFEDFATKFPGLKDVQREPAYAFKAYPAAGLTSLTLFDESFGTATLGYADTNLVTPNQFPAGEAQLVTGLRLVPIPSSTDVFAVNASGLAALLQWYDVLQLNGWMEWWILQKPFLRIAPLTAVPSGMGLGALATAGAAAANLRNVGTVQSGSPDNRSVYVVDPPQLLESLTNFYILLQWRALNLVTTAGRIGVHLDGYHIRNVQ